MVWTNLPMPAQDASTKGCLDSTLPRMTVRLRRLQRASLLRVEARNSSRALALHGLGAPRASRIIAIYTLGLHARASLLLSVLAAYARGNNT